MYNTSGNYWWAYLMSLVCLLSACSDSAIEPQLLPDDAASLEGLLKMSESTEEQMDIYYKLSFAYGYSDPGLAVHYLNKQLSLAEMTNDDFQKAKAYSRIGIFKRKSGELKEALKYYLQSISVFDEIGERSREADNLNNIGSIFIDAKGYSDAIPYYLKAASIYQQTGDQRYEIISRTNLAFCYSAPMVNRLAEAQNELIEAIGIQKEMDLANEVRLAYLYNELGRIYFIAKEYDKALEQYSTALSYEKDMDNESRSDIYHNMAEAYLYKGNFDEAHNWIDIAHNLSDATSSNDRIMVRRLNIEAELYQKEGEYNKALAISEKAIKISNKEVVNEPLQEALELALKSEKMISQSGVRVATADVFKLTDMQARQDELRDEFNSIDRKPLLSVLSDEANKYQAKMQILENSAYNKLITTVSSVIVFILLGVIAFIVINEKRKKLILKAKSDYCIDLVENWDKHMGKNKNV